jgi:hypothetical protein
MNIKLLRKVKNYILEEPRRFDMSTFGSVFKSKINFKDATGESARNFPPCGTTACIAGWALGVNAPRPKSFFKKLKYGAIPNLAQKKLRLSHEEKERLFYDASWPSKYSLALLAAKTPAGRARVAAERIEHFIATDGKE